MSLSTEIKVIQKGKDWWLMSKNPVLKEMNPVGQRFVKMQFPKILKVVHTNEKDAEEEANWLRDHIVNWEKKLDRRARKQARKTS